MLHKETLNYPPPKCRPEGGFKRMRLLVGSLQLPALYHEEVVILCLFVPYEIMINPTHNNKTIKTIYICFKKELRIN